MGKVSMDLLVSVIIPFYNRSASIRRSLNSLFLEGNFEYVNEVVIVDDGSSSEEFKRLQDIITETTREYGVCHSFIKLLRCDTNINASHARNVGIQNASSEILAFLDSDDEWLENKLKVQLQHFHKDKVVFSQFLKINRTKSKSEIYPSVFYNNIPKYLLSGVGHIQTSTMLLSKSLASNVLFNDRLGKYQDWDFAIRLFGHGAEFKFCKEPLVNYYVDATDRIGTKFKYEQAVDLTNSIFNNVEQRLIEDFLYNRKIIAFVSNGEYLKAAWLMLHCHFMFRLHPNLKKQAFSFFVKRRLLSLRLLEKIKTINL